MKKTLFILALLAVACTKVVEIESEPVAKDEVKTIPYSVTVSSEQTRATVDDRDLMTLRFATGDRLYISSDTRADVYGVLTLKTGAGETGENGEVVFTGDLNYTGDVPSDDLLLNATLVGANNKGVQISEGRVTGMKYPELKEFCTSVNDAVQKYSLLTGVGTFGRKRFPLSQHTAFLNFAVTVPKSYLTNTETSYAAFMVNDGKINGENTVLIGTFKLTKNSNTVSFVLPVAENTVLNNATINLINAGGYQTSSDTYSASFGSIDSNGNSVPKTLSPKVYNVTKTAAKHTGYVNTGLPVIDIQGVTTAVIHADKNRENPVTISIQGTDEYPGLETKTATIKGRGNTTWGWDKKPYKLKLDTKESLLGMNSNKHWVLLANCMDRTMMRNLVAMKISSMATNLEWTPSCVPVELYIGGVHQGTYLLIEQVRVGSNRVNIKEIEPPKEGETAIAPEAGGYLLELDFHWDNEVQWEDPHGKARNTHGTSDYDGIPFSIKSPDIEDFAILDEEGHIQRNAAGDIIVDPMFRNDEDEDEITYQKYIQQYIFDTAKAIYSTNFQNPRTGLSYDQYIDVNSFIDYWLVFELMGNHELSNPGSVYMYKKQQKKGGKLFAGPCWDFDWGTLSYKYNNLHPNPGGLAPETDLINWTEYAIWYGRLKDDQSFRSALKNRFSVLLPQFKTIPDYMDEWERLLAVSEIYNYKLWKTNAAGTNNGDENLSFHEAVANIKKIYNDRLTKVIIPKLNAF